MSQSRRDFLKKGLLGGAAASLTGFSAPEKAQAEIKLKDPAILKAKKTYSVCPYCAVGCGLIVYTSKKDGSLIHIEGDPDHPISRGSLCAKGAGLKQLALNPDRLTKVLYRAPYSSIWEEKPWNWALNRLAKVVKLTRDADLIQRDEQGRKVNRVESMAHLGSAALDNEECWLLQAVMRCLGLVNIEHQARI